VTRFLPPHLMALVILLIAVVWFMLLHHFRHSVSLQRFVSELFGDNTPESALRNFEFARQRLSEHLSDNSLDQQIRQQIEFALGMESDDHGQH
jgi:hypothetical protein